MTVQSRVLSEELVDYTLGLRDGDVPAEVMDRAKQLFLDFIGVALGGKVLAEAGAPLLQSVNDLSQGQEGPCTVVGEADKRPSHYAALLNGAFAHSMDFDDTHRRAVMHPGAPIFSTLMAVGEEKGRSGREFLTAAIAAYDVVNKIGKAEGDGVHMRGFHPTATAGIFAATMGAARLMGLSRDQAINAMGINISQAAGSQQFIEFGGWNKPFHVGMAAHNAIYALALAKRGYIGATNPLEGRFGYFYSYSAEGWDPSKITGLGTEFEMMFTSIKPYPCCRYNHAVIEAVVDLVRDHQLVPEDITSIDIYINPTGHELVGEPVHVKQEPTSIVLGQFSVYFAAAVAAVDGEFSWQSYSKLQDPTMRGLMSVTRSLPTPEMQPMACRVEMATRSGLNLTKDVPYPKGEPENPLSWDEAIAKFIGLTQQTLGLEGAQKVVRSVRELDQVADIRSFTEVLRP